MVGTVELVLVFSQKDDVWVPFALFELGWSLDLLGFLGLFGLLYFLFLATSQFALF